MEDKNKFDELDPAKIIEEMRQEGGILTVP